jgi:hypothetical protein
MCKENFTHTWIRSPNRPTGSESLYMEVVIKKAIRFTASYKTSLINPSSSINVSLYWKLISDRPEEEWVESR